MNGDVNPETVGNLEEEIGKIAATIKSYHFEEGSTYGYMAVIIPES